MLQCRALLKHDKARKVGPYRMYKEIVQKETWEILLTDDAIAGTQKCVSQPRFPCPSATVFLLQQRVASSASFASQVNSVNLPELEKKLR